jgi:diguanylate cyclase (GGDEF)-like protein
MINGEKIATRFSPSCEIPRIEPAGPSLLVRICPVKGIERPWELQDGPMLIGRDSNCSLVLPDDSISRRHATIEPHEGGHLISDLGSTNGTYVNEQRLFSARRLQAGDRVRFGNQIFKYLSADRIEAQYHEVVFKLMTTDGLTSVYNKRYLLETLERERHQARRAGTPLSVLMLDLDRFKSVNDRFGHLAGDAVLVEFARRAKSVLRSGDLLARYGGEEFTMVLTRATLGDAMQIAERVRLLVEATPVLFEDQIIPITVSIGVCCDDGSSIDETADLLRLADEQLYEAKVSGRNRVHSSKRTNT